MRIFGFVIERVGTWRKRKEELSIARNRLAALEFRVMAAHPSGSDPEAEPQKVIEVLGKEWLEMVHRPPEAKIEFVDEDGKTYTLYWEDGEDGGGYILYHHVVTPALKDRIDRVIRAAQRWRSKARPRSENAVNLVYAVDAYNDPLDPTIPDEGEDVGEGATT